MAHTLVSWVLRVLVSRHPAVYTQPWMRFLCRAVVLWALVARMQAATIDVTSLNTQELESGDSLAFLFTDSSYAKFASGMGISTDPSQIFFDLTSAPVGSAGQFTVAVESGDGSASSVSPVPVDWSIGVVETSEYGGPASVITDRLTLSSPLSQAIFAGSWAELILTYTGPDVTVGLPGYSLKNDLTISLVGGSLSMGALDYGVALNDGLDAASVVPEPDSGMLLVAAGLLLCAISLAIRRFGISR